MVYRYCCTYPGHTVLEFVGRKCPIITRVLVFVSTAVIHKQIPFRVFLLVLLFFVAMLHVCNCYAGVVFYFIL